MSRPYPVWKSWLSYFWDITLWSGPGEHTEHLAVKLRQGLVLLEANGAVYSWEDRYYNFREAFAHLNWDELPGKRTLLLGMGLGSVPQIAEEQFSAGLSYSCIEYDGVIASLAEQYLLNRLSAPIEVHVVDAGEFVRMAEPGAYDLILVDLFTDDYVPTAFEQADFLENLKHILKPAGCLISNRLAYRATDIASAETYIAEVFLPIFPDAEVLDVASNWMLFSDVRFLREADD